MTRPVSIVVQMILSGALVAAVAGCGGADDETGAASDPNSVATEDNSATDGSALRWSARQRRARLGVSAPTSTSTNATSSAGSTVPAPSAGGTPDFAAVAARAQTPDGSAIPQPAGPNGECPEAVVVFGFWSCPNLNEQCSFAQGGATTACTCTRSDGEGQFPSWVCAPASAP
jgi:hypothetical protein